MPIAAQRPTARSSSRTEYAHYAGRNQPDAHKIASVRAIANDAGDKFRHPRGDVSCRQADIAATQNAAGKDQARRALKLTGEIEQRVTQIQMRSGYAAASSDSALTSCLR